MTAANRFGTMRIGLVGPWRDDLGGRNKVVDQVPRPSSATGIYDLLIVTFVGDVPGEWASVLVSALIAGTPVRSLGEYIESEHQRIVATSFDAADGLGARGRAYRRLKATIEWSLILVSLPISVPVAALVAASILLSMGRPILFRQTRVGYGGENFEILKFRTMSNKRVGGDVTVVDDKRVTRLGRLLRHFHVDELPQLVNVLQGSMSLVGPRPEQLTRTRDYILSSPAFAFRVLVPPGMTGWAQVRAGYAANAVETKLKLELDLYYIKHQSLMFDAEILARTAAVILMGRGGR